MYGTIIDRSLRVHIWKDIDFRGRHIYKVSMHMRRRFWFDKKIGVSNFYHRNEAIDHMARILKD